MAQRYWVGGTAAWDNTAGTKWATTSGGGGGSAVPTTADQVFFDANSGTGNCTIQTAVATPGSLDFTGYTGTLTQSSNVNMGSATLGDLTLYSGMTFAWVSGQIKLSSSQAGNTNVDLAGKTIGNIAFNSAVTTFVLQNDINASGLVAFSGGTVDMNGYNITCKNLSNGNTTTRTTNMRGGTITMTGTGAVFDAPGGSLTFTWTTGAKFVISDTSATAKTFAGSTLSYPDIEVSGAASNGILTFSGAFTTTGLKLNPDTSVKFTAGTTTTATALNWVGTSGHLITIQSTSSGSPATISVASGTVNADYLSLQDSAATGGATFNAGSHSTNVSGNTGWSFGNTGFTFAFV